MSKRWEKPTEKFWAESADGQLVQLLISTTMISTSRFGDPNPTISEGKQTVRTIDGRSCNLIDDETFVIVESGLRLKRAKSR